MRSMQAGAAAIFPPGTVIADAAIELMEKLGVKRSVTIRGTPQPDSGFAVNGGTAR